MKSDQYGGFDRLGDKHGVFDGVAPQPPQKAAWDTFADGIKAEAGVLYTPLYGHSDK
jgi:hypothetical protein